MTRFLDLDAVVVPNLAVKLGGQEYIVPGSPDVPRMLRWMSYEERFDATSAEDSIALLKEVYEDLLDLFQIHQPKLKALPIHQEQIQPLFEGLFGQASVTADPPTKPPAARRNKRN